MSENILIKAAPVDSFDRSAAALNVVGASTSASRGSLETTGANIIYVDTVAGNDTTGAGTSGNPYKTITKAVSVWGSGKTIEIKNNDAITLNSGAETATGIDRPVQAAVGVAPEISLSGAWTMTARTQHASITGGFLSAAYNGTTYVLGDGNGNLTSSTDGVTWAAVTEAAGFGANAIWTIHWGNGLFVAAGANGKIMTSPDGATWTDRTAATGWSTSVIYSGTWGHQGHALCGGSGIMTSTDGITWTLQTITSVFPAAPTDFLSSAAYGEGKYIFVSGQQNSKRIVYSADLINFYGATRTTTNDAVTGVNRIAYGNGRFVITNPQGSMEYSDDGIAWYESTPATSGIAWEGVRYGGGHFVAFGDFTYNTSPDGETWTYRASSFGTSDTQCGVFGHAGWVFGREAGTNRVETCLGAIRLKSSLCGFNVSAEGLYIAATNNAPTLLNVSADLGIHALKDPNGFTVKNCLANTIRANENLIAEMSENDISENIDLISSVNGSTLFNKNTVAGHYSDWGTTTTAPSQWRSNIIVGGIYTNRVFTIPDGNRTGYLSPSVSLAAGTTSSLSPLFISATDRRLRRKGDGYASDSPLLERSAFYTYTGSDAATYDRDIGAYSFDASYAVREYTRAIEVPRPNSVVWNYFPLATYARTIGGVPQGRNRTSGNVEGVSMTWANWTEENWQQLRELFLDFASVEVKLFWDAAYSATGTVTVNGNQSAGVSYLTVDSTTDCPAGSVVTIAGVDYRVMRTTATRLILNTETADAVLDNAVLTVKEAPASATYDGEYILIWPEFGLVPVNSNDFSNWAGISLSFERKPVSV